MNFLLSFRVQRIAQQLRRVPECVSRALVSTPDPPEERELSASVSEHIKKQVLHAGLHYLSDVETLKQNMNNRKFDVDLEKLIALHDLYKMLVHRLKESRHKRNTASKQYVQLKSPEEKAGVVGLGSQLKQNISYLENEKNTLENDMLSLLSLIPNYCHPDTPVGEYEDSRVLEHCGEMPEFSFDVKGHIHLGKNLGLFDFQAAAEASGSSFYYLEGGAALLEIALIQFAMQKAVAKGYRPMITPDVIKTDLVEGCGFNPRGAHSQVYHVSSHHNGGSTQCLSGTAEIPLAGKYMKSVLPLDQLPIRLVAFGRCFRAETGGKGHGSRGLYRVHQFSKVELFGLTAQEEGSESQQLLEEFLSLQKDILSSLGLHYRVLEMATAELGGPAYRKYDIEVWMPGRGEYGEVTSASNCTDYQSRRLLTSYPNPDKLRVPKRKYAHTVNGTACAVPRTIIALLENYQQEDGSVVLPEVLRPFLPKHYWHLKPNVG
ncbi:uncharacterized protein LOC135348852 isoform X1 [Halichondria panicea]|uniref:uncharacterized protein LOC135348852 isoform X1 n=1 Tax=Halichondria panicea TaxID=6063 RepID=UPI00312B8D59